MIYIYSDLYRYAKKVDKRTLIKNFIFNPRFKYSFYMRICNKLNKNKYMNKNILIIFKVLLKNCSYKYGIQIPYSTNIDKGLYIVHWGGIVINPNCIIGKNLTISQGVTLGQVSRGERRGSPRIGNNVYIGPGAKVIGNISIGNNSAIGANCVVTKDIPDNAVVVGIPGKVISYKGSDGYIHNKYE